MRSLYLLIAALMLCACQTSMTPSTPPTNPLLDQYLASDCKPIEKPTSPDYDVWQMWVSALIVDYADCAVRHRKTVDAWAR